jgi:hypothetical protein
MLYWFQVYVKFVSNTVNSQISAMFLLIGKMQQDRDRIIQTHISDLRQVGGFLWVLRFPLPIKLTATYNWNIVETGVIHHKIKPNLAFVKIFVNQNNKEDRKCNKITWYLPSVRHLEFIFFQQDSGLNLISHSLRANTLARSPVQVKLDSDKWKLWKNLFE